MSAVPLFHGAGLVANAYLAGKPTTCPQERKDPLLVPQRRLPTQNSIVYPKKQEHLTPRAPAFDQPRLQLLQFSLASLPASENSDYDQPPCYYS
jgi:hypothetical protein